MRISLDQIKKYIRTKEVATAEAVRLYGPGAYAEKPVTMYGGFYECPYRIILDGKIVGWGHSWRQALAGPCPHYKGEWPSKPVVIACVVVPESPFVKKEMARHG